MSAIQSKKSLGRVLLEIPRHLIFLCFWVAVMWILEIFDTVLFNSLDSFGIKPRVVDSLPGIFTAPFLHLGFSHLISNTVPFFVLGGLVLVGGKRVFIVATLMIAIIGGGALWLVGPANTNHIGASLVIFGYLGFLLTRGIFERSPFWIVVSVIILIVYGSMIFGVLPGQPEVSWQGHLFGFIAGIISAKVLVSKEKSLYR